MRHEARHPAIPSPSLLNLQAHWLSSARTRLLRRANIAKRRVVVDLAAGSCVVSAELARRSNGTVIAIDASARALQHAGDKAIAANIQRACAYAEVLPLADASVDLVFVQCAMLWFDQPKNVADEIARVLRPGGALAAIEPDYGGLIEHPPQIALQDVWISALTRCGADPYIGRKLPAIFSAAGLSVEVQLLERLEAPQPERFDLLSELPLTDQEAERLRQARDEASRMAAATVAHLPFFLVLGEKPR